MPHTHPPILNRSGQGDGILKRLMIDTGPKIRFLNIHGFKSVLASTPVDVLLLRTITRPHIIRTFQPIANLAPGNDVAVDVLLSSDTLIDTSAEVRDRHLSGGRLATDGWQATIFASPWAINIPVASWWTVYKLAMRNVTLGAVTFDVNFTIELI